MSEPIDLTPHLAHALPRTPFTMPRRLLGPWLGAGLLSSMLLLTACGGGGGGGGEPNANSTGLVSGGVVGQGGTSGVCADRKLSHL